MRAGKREARYAVVERSRVPTFRRVAVRAVPYRESRARGRVHGIVRLLPSRQVTLRVAAIVRRNLQVVVVVDVAIRAGRSGMAKRERKSRKAVIEIRCVPSLWRMARGAVRSGKDGAGRGMRRVVRFLPCRKVAPGIAAVRRSDLQVVVVVDVAVGTRNVRVPVGEQETRC